MTWPAYLWFTIAGLALSAGCWWFSPGAGLICAGVYVTAVVSARVALELGGVIDDAPDQTPTDRT